MSGICAELCCCGMPYTCLNGIIGGCIDLCVSTLPNGISYFMSSGLTGTLALCGYACSSLTSIVSGLLGGMIGGGGSTGGVVTEALPAVMQNAGGGK